jgi:hypothetical protein
MGSSGAGAARRGVLRRGCASPHSPTAQEFAAEEFAAEESEEIAPGSQMEMDCELFIEQYKWLLPGKDNVKASVR